MLCKGSDWTETQIKRIGDSHQDIWGCDNKMIRTEQKYTLVEDYTSFQMRRMTTRTDQLLCIAEATGSKIYMRESEVENHIQAKALIHVLETVSCSLLQALKKGTTRAMVCPKGLHTSDAFPHLNVLAIMGLKSFCPWCFKFTGNSETITTHLREMHYRLAIACDIS